MKVGDKVIVTTRFKRGPLIGDIVTVETCAPNRAGGYAIGIRHGSSRFCYAVCDEDVVPDTPAARILYCANKH